MTEAEKQETGFQFSKRFVAYDKQNGDIVYIHEFMGVSGDYENAQKLESIDAIRKLAYREFEGRDLDIVEVPDDVELGQDASYRIDLATGAFTEIPSETVTFREFVKQHETS